MMQLVRLRQMREGLRTFPDTSEPSRVLLSIDVVVMIEGPPSNGSTEAIEGPPSKGSSGSAPRGPTSISSCLTCSHSSLSRKRQSKPVSRSLTSSNFHRDTFGSNLSCRGSSLLLSWDEVDGLCVLDPE